MFADSVFAQSPLTGFTLLLLCALVVPPIFERLRLPGLVGLLVAGVVLGPSLLGLLDHKSETMGLLSDVGKIYLMFVAGLEIDLADFRRTKQRSLAFGLSTFLVPMVGGMIVGHFVAGLGWNASILVGSLLASHTLLGFPIVSRLGLARNEAVTVTIGATIFTDVAALMVLALCLSVHSSGSFSAVQLLRLLTILGLYSAVVLVGFDWAGREFFRRTGDEDGNQFLFVLLAVFLAAIAAQLLQIEQIVGAFLAGLAVNDVVGRGPVAEKIEFVGSTLFIPFFFVDMGLLLDLGGLWQTLTGALGISLAIVAMLILTKFLAAAIVGRWFRYSRDEILTMWSLSLPQVAATLAAALAGVNAGVLPPSLFNSVILLMLVTAIAGPVLTDRFAHRLLERESPGQGLALGEADLLAETGLGQPFLDRETQVKVLLPVANPNTEKALLKLGGAFVRPSQGQLLPLSIAQGHLHMDTQELSQQLQSRQRLLDRAVALGDSLGIETVPQLRIDNDIALGITRTARERDCDLILMGASGQSWYAPQSLGTALFGSVIDQVIWSAHCPVIVARLLDEPENLRRILVPVKWLTPRVVAMVRLTLQLAEAQEASLEILRIYDDRQGSSQAESFEQRLRERVPLPESCQVRMLCNNNMGDAILAAAQEVDLVVLGFSRRRTAGGLSTTDGTAQLAQQLPCSTLVFGLPHS
ncbi:MAG: universal stress protein [Synechococcales cyanobacterium RM1_1_8]|nr:universal stress protein [Synechococcales cyanobacterium RM1_1_8]